MTTKLDSIPARSSPGLSRTAPSVEHQGKGEKYATDTPKNRISARNNITMGTWNVRTLRKAGKLEEFLQPASGGFGSSSKERCTHSAR